MIPRTIFIALSSALLLASCTSETDKALQNARAGRPPEPPPFTPPAGAKSWTTPSGLGIEDLTVGTGAEATSGDNVKVHYTGTLTDGTKFDSSLDRGDPFTFRIDGGQVIKGWDEGVKGMKVGGKRKLRIPSKLGYGDQGSPPKIPGGAELLFEIELLGVN